MSYVDGYLLVVPKKKVDAYKKMALLGKKAWMKHGALDYKECVGEDLKTKCGLPFGKLMKTKGTETVVFAYIVYRNRKHRDKVNAAVIKEMSTMKWDPADMPMDMKRMAFGGFEGLVEA